MTVVEEFIEQSRIINRWTVLEHPHWTTLAHPLVCRYFPNNSPTHPLYGLSIELLWMEWFPNRVNGLSGPEHLPTYATFKGRGKNFIWLTVQSLILVPKISIIHFYWQTQWNHGLLQILQCFQLFLKVSKFCSLLRINNFLHFNYEFS